MSKKPNAELLQVIDKIKNSRLVHLQRENTSKFSSFEAWYASLDPVQMEFAEMWIINSIFGGVEVLIQ